MARLGKREREAKRALIKSNLNGPCERTPRSMGSYLSTNRMLARTHVGFRNPHNAKGSGMSSSSVGRFSEQPRKLDAINGPTAKVFGADTLRDKALKSQLRKQLAK